MQTLLEVWIFSLKPTEWQTLKKNNISVYRTFISSEHSDEEMELWARTLDLPGFDDNVSPNNTITMLLRFVIGEVSYISNEEHKEWFILFESFYTG